VHKSLETDTEDLYDLIHGEYADDDIMLHLRYTTAGETSMRNAHPFPVLEYDSDGVDLRMCHNGTLFKYKPTPKSDNSWESDTRVFVRKFVRPLAKRFIHQYKRDQLHEGHVLNDEFFYDLLYKELSAQSVLAFFDGFGNALQVNGTGNGGKYEEDLWVSNTYSFDTEHRKPKKTSGGMVTNGSTGSMVDTHSSTNTQKFTEKHEIDEEDLFTMSDFTIELLVDEEPEDAEALIKELLYLYKKNKDKAESLEKELSRVKQKHEKASKHIEEVKKNDKVA
jgi:hypothetical protein